MISLDGSYVGSNEVSTGIAFAALADVAKWLGYKDITAYNTACEGHPQQVFRQLQEAT